MSAVKDVVWKAFGAYKGGFLQELYLRYRMDVRSENNKEAFIRKGLSNAQRFELPTNAQNIRALLANAEIAPDESARFFYSIDVFKSYKTFDRVVLNCTPDWDGVINNPLSSLIIAPTDDDRMNDIAFIDENNMTINAIIDYLHRTIEFVEHSSFGNKEQIAAWLSGLETRGAQSFDEALQRLLFVNEVFWQTPHNLIGLGRLDLLLGDLYEADLAAGRITQEAALESIRQFLTLLHNYYWYKSGALMGDTGQVIILGGKQPDGSYFSNGLTHLFINAIRELQIPDPKILLRVSDDLPEDLMICALDCVKTGVGNPLFSNDELVIPAMIEFGYSEEDSYNYVTSACWEPLVPGVAHEQNNLVDLHFLLPLIFMSAEGRMGDFQTFEEFFSAYMEELDTVCGFVCNDLDSLKWDLDPLMSAFTPSCRAHRIDVALGGGIYNNYGVLSLGMGNLINSLFNVRKFVFEEKRFTLAEFDLMRKSDFAGHEDVLELLKNEDKAFGCDTDEALEMTRVIMKRVEENFIEYRNRYGGRIKCGLSSPSYIMASHLTEASFDGRKYGEPYATHISAEGANSYTDLMVFASRLDYTGIKYNGNVVDFFATPQFIDNNYEKFLKLIMTSFKMGVFQMQINVVSAATLIDAREHPENYPNLIVRVWGFSAYFIDLPDEYKDNLIKRALQSEGTD